MAEPSTADGPRLSTVIAVVIGFLVGIVVVLGGVFDMGLLEIGVLVVPILVVSALSLLALLWAKRRGDF